LNRKPEIKVADAESGSSNISASKHDSKKIPTDNPTFVGSGFSAEPTPTQIFEPETGNQDGGR